MFLIVEHFRLAPGGWWW